VLNRVTIVCIIALAITVLFFAFLPPASLNQAQGQLLPGCPVGYQRDVFGNCEPVSNMQTCPIGYQRSSSGICVPISSQSCPIGYQRSASGFCVPVTSLQSCPVGYQTYPPGICVPVADSLSNLYPYGYPTTAVTPQTTFTQPQTTFTQPPASASSLVSPTLTNSPAGQISPWFPSLPAIACGGTSTMTTIGSIERDDNGDDNNNNGRDNDDDNDDDKKDYAFQIESDGGPSADPESVDGTVFAGEKNIARNNGEDFDIKDVFNDCQVSMFND
jgi:hypothetical protein